MKFLRLLIKPKWQHKDADVRRRAVASDHDAELVAKLAEIARTDADAGVRLAALRRLDDYEAWRERSTGDADASLRQTARGVYLGLLLGNGRNVPAIARRIAELDTLAADELERVATEATDVELRGAAQARVRRPSLLVDRAINDPDPALRQAALARLDDADALARIAERTRKTDKVVSRIARERLESARIASGDAATIEARARALCERIEALLSTARSERGPALEAITTSWNEIAERAPPQLRERYVASRDFLLGDTEEAAAERAQLRELRAQLDAVAPKLSTTATQDLEQLAAHAANVLAANRRDLAERTAVEERLSRVMQQLAARAAAPPPEVDVVAETPVPVEESAEAIEARVRFDAQLAATHAEKQRDRERQQQLRADVDADVRLLEEKLEAGDVTAAHEIHARIATALKDLPEVARHDRRLQAAQARYAELKRWQHWSNNERRKALCDALEALPAAGLHPDAVATRVREARLEWQALDGSEGAAAPADGARPTQGLARRFHALCNIALKPTRGYFDKRTELRKTHLKDYETLLGADAAAGDESADFDALTARRRALAEALRGLDAVDPRERKALAQRLKDAMASIDARLDARAEDIAAQRRRLIDKAQKAAQSGDLLAAARELRDLQAQWKAIPRGKRSVDDALWKTFRAAADEVFGRLDADRRERDERAASARNAAAALVAELEALPEGLESRAARRDLEKRWAELDLRDRALDARWRAGLERLDRAVQAAERTQRLQLFTHALQRLALCRELEGGSLDAAAAATRWQETPEVPGDVGVALKARYDAALSGAPTRLATADLNDARDVLVRLEFLGAVETPAVDGQRRMDWQVSRLSRRMTMGASPAPREELADLLAQWISLGGINGAAAEEFQPRFERAFGAALGQLP